MHDIDSIAFFLFLFGWAEEGGAAVLDGFLDSAGDFDFAVTFWAWHPLSVVDGPLVLEVSAGVIGMSVVLSGASPGADGVVEDGDDRVCEFLALAGG